MSSFHSCSHADLYSKHLLRAAPCAGSWDAAVSRTHSVLRSQESGGGRELKSGCVGRDAGAQGTHKLCLAGEGRRKLREASFMDRGFSGSV